MRRHTLLVAFLTLCALPAFAGPDGNQILDKCQTTIRLYDNNQEGSAQENLDSGWCIGWVGSIVELNHMHLDTSEISGKPDLFQFCPPKQGLSGIQAIRVVVKFLQEHPEELHRRGVVLTIAALKQGFPCSSSDVKP